MRALIMKFSLPRSMNRLENSFILAPSLYGRVASSSLDEEVRLSRRSATIQESDSERLLDVMFGRVEET